MPISADSVSASGQSDALDALLASAATPEAAGHALIASTRKLVSARLMLLLADDGAVLAADDLPADAPTRQAAPAAVSARLAEVAEATVWERAALPPPLASWLAEDDPDNLLAVPLLAGGARVGSFLVLDFAARPDREATIRGIVRLCRVQALIMGLAATRRSEELLRRRELHADELVEVRTGELRDKQERLEAVLEATGTGLWQWNPVNGEIDFSRTYYTMLGWEPGAFSADARDWQRLVHPDDLPSMRQTLRHAAGSPENISFSLQFRMRNRSGGWRWILSRGEIVERDPAGRVRRIVGVNADVTERKGIDAQERLRADVLEKLARGTELPVVLEAVVRGIEAAQPGCIASILLVDEERRLRLGAVPSLPDWFCAPIDGTPIGEGVGSCGTAACRGELVVVDDIQEHLYWAPFRDLATRAGIAACWSQPVFDSHGRVVATVAMYAGTPGKPTWRDLATLKYAANLTSIAIDRRQEEKQLRMAMAALEHTHESVYWLDERGRMLYVNPAVEQELGYSAAELRSMSVPDIDPGTPAGHWGAEGKLTRSLNERGLRRFATQHRHRDGRMIPVEVDSDPFDYEGQRYYIAICRNISERQAAEEALRQSEAKFAAMFSLTPDPMALTRLADGAVIEASHSYAEYFGYAPHELIGHSTLPGDLGLWIEPEQRRHWRERLEREGEVLGFETPLRRKDGSQVTAMVSGRMTEFDGERCVIVAIRDISELKRNEERLDQMAHHDALTNLPNRLLLGDRLRQAVAQNRRAGTRVAVCYLDLDGFKAINDRFGHEAGDRLLIEVAGRLTGNVRGGDTVARLGGDEFVLLITGLAGDEDCHLALDRLLAAISAPYLARAGEPVSISASIGVTIFPSDSADPDTLVRHADHAMYAAKQAGKNRYHLFDANLERRIEVHQATLKRIEAALAAGQFRLYYQPKVDCRHGRVVGAEALIRWQHPTLGLVSPAEFLPLVESDALAVPVGQWVLRDALRQMTAWRRAGVDLPVSVNTFARQLLHPGFTDGLAGLLAAHPDIAPGNLTIEIVETADLKELDAIRQVIEDCQALGVGFSLDDFGTGYSSLVYLRHFPAQEIKIDQSFVRNVLTIAEDQAIVEAVIGLGRAFRRAVVGEGAETPQHVARLLALGCDVMQGYALARPMPAADLVRWMESFAPDPGWQASAGWPRRPGGDMEPTYA